MRRFDKKHNIEKANLLAEQRYLVSKGLLKEELINENGRADRDLTDEANFAELKEMLMNYLHQGRTNSAAMANDNKAILYDYLETMWSPQDLHMGANSNEIRTNNPELITKFLAKKGISGKSFVK